MPGEIQTSFIPKAPITASARPAQQSSVGFMTVIGLILALSSAAVFGGAFFYKTIIGQRVADVQGRIESLKSEMPIENLKKIEATSISLSNAKNLLEKHVSSNRVFSLLASSTVPSVRFTSFDFKGDEVSVKGATKSYEDVAAQAQIFESEAMKSKILSYEFSDFTVDKITNTVTFSLALTVAPAAFRYDPTDSFGSTILPNRSVATGTAATSTIR